MWIVLAGWGAKPDERGGLIHLHRDRGFAHGGVRIGGAPVNDRRQFDAQDGAEHELFARHIDSLDARVTKLERRGYGADLSAYSRAGRSSRISKTLELWGAV